MHLLHRFLPIPLFLILLLTVGCTFPKETDNKNDASNTEIHKDNQPQEKVPNNEQQQPNTIGVPKRENDFSKVQVIVNEERFIEEVCEFDNGRYGFKCTRPTIIDFSANWCRPCGEIAPYLVEFANQYNGKIAIYKIDIDKCPNIAQQFRIKSIPTLIFVKPHRQPSKIEGAMSKENLQQLIHDLLLS